MTKVTENQAITRLYSLLSDNQRRSVLAMSTDQYKSTVGVRWKDKGFNVIVKKAVKVWWDLQEAAAAPEAIEKFSGFQAEPYEILIKRPERLQFICAYLLENGSIYYALKAEGVILFHELSLGSSLTNSGMHEGRLLIDGFAITKRPDNRVFMKDQKYRKELAKMSDYAACFFDTMLGL